MPSAVAAEGGVCATANKLLRRVVVVVVVGTRDEGRKAGEADFGTRGLDVRAGVDWVGMAREDLRVEGEEGRDVGVETLRLDFIDDEIVGDMVDCRPDERRKFVLGVMGLFA